MLIERKAAREVGPSCKKDPDFGMVQFCCDEDSGRRDSRIRGIVNQVTNLLRLLPRVESNDDAAKRNKIWIKASGINCGSRTLNGNRTHGDFLQNITLASGIVEMNSWEEILCFFQNAVEIKKRNVLENAKKSSIAASMLEPIRVMTLKSAAHR